MKLFQQMLVAGATLSLMAPIATQASDVVNLEEMSNYSRSRKKKSLKFDSRTFINQVSEDIANLNGRVDGLEVRQNEYEAGGFSDTTTLDGKAVFSLMGTDFAKADSTQSEAVVGMYMYQMNLNTSFTGDDNLYIRLKAGNHTGHSTTKTYGTYLSAAKGGSDALGVDKIWYTFPYRENHTFWVGPKIENYYMHATTPSIYKPVTKQFTLGGNGDAYAASTNAGAGWAYKFDNGIALSTNFVSQNNAASTGLWTNESATSWATQAGYTTNQWSISAILNNKYNGWGDSYYHSGNHSPASGGDNLAAVGLRSWWRPTDTGTIVPSISLGYDTSSHLDAPDSSDKTTAWFAGFNWQDAFQVDDRVGIAFGQPTLNEAETTDPFAFEMYYSFKVNDSMTVTPAYFANSSRSGTGGDDVSGVVLNTEFKF